MNNIAILYQSTLPPIKNGIRKPPKPGGYSDSGADIACELLANQVRVVLPTSSPDITTDKDWVFPDTRNGIEKALEKGASTLWLNTVLYKGHPVETFFDEDIRFVGQTPESVDVYDDKFYTNQRLKSSGIPVPETMLIDNEELIDAAISMAFPLVVKPIRGRGSQGVCLVHSQQELRQKLNEIFSKGEYGHSVYVEKYLNGQEITITVMPKGTYHLNNEPAFFDQPWCLPAVKRFNHKNGIAPYSGVVAVMENSAVLPDDDLQSDSIQKVYSDCAKAAEQLQIKAPIRIDCRANETGEYLLFDVNLKPNMTGSSRPHRENQDSLTLMAARKIGWTYFDLLNNMLNQQWEVGGFD